MPAQPEGYRFTISVDGCAIPAAPGQTVAAALLAAGITAFRHTAQGHARSIFCGMGVCFDCLVTIDGMPGQRACMTPVTPNLQVRTGQQVPSHPEGANERG